MVLKKNIKIKQKKRETIELKETKKVWRSPRLSSLEIHSTLGGEGAAEFSWGGTGPTASTG